MATSENCTPCARKQKVSVPLTFCRVCDQTYCETCLEFHDNIFGVNNHDMVATKGRTFTSATDDKQQSAVSKEMCKLHPVESISLYCFPHDEVFCQVCKTTKHRECIGVEFISQACKSFRRTAEVDKDKTNVEKTLNKLSSIETMCQQEERKTEKEMTMLIDSVRQFRQRAVEMIDDMEREAVDVIKTRYFNIKEKLARDIGACHKQMDTLDHLNQLYYNYNNSNGDDLYPLFIFAKMCRNTLANGRRVASDVEAWLSYDGLQISLDTSIEDRLKGMRLVNCAEDKKQKDKLACHPESVKTDDMQLIKVKAEKDTSSCKITSICQLEDGWFVVSDYDNSNIKLFDSGFNFVNAIGVGDWPNKVCQTGPHEVSLGMEYVTSGAIILFRIAEVQGTRQFVRLSKIKMKHYCLGLTYSDGEYYMSDLDGKIHVYDKSCSAHRIVYKGDFIKDITFSSDLTTVFIADESKGLVILDRCSGNPQVIKAELRKPISLTPDRDGGVFVCDQKLRNIIHFNKTGSKVSQPLLEFEPHRKKPRSIHFDQQTNRIIIGYQGYDFLEHVQLSF